MTMLLPPGYDECLITLHTYVVGHFVQANMFEKLRAGGLNDLQSYWKFCTKCTLRVFHVKSGV